MRYNYYYTPTRNYCCCSVAQSCPTLCDLVDCSTPGFHIVHYIPEFAQTHTHWVSDWPYHPLSSLFSSPQYFPESGSFPMSWLFTSGGQSNGVSASAPVLPIRGWFPLGLTGLFLLLSKGLSLSLFFFFILITFFKFFKFVFYFLNFKIFNSYMRSQPWNPLPPPSP